jgi:hypothetical protein
MTHAKIKSKKEKKPSQNSLDFENIKGITSKVLLSSEYPH